MGKGYFILLSALVLGSCSQASKESASKSDDAIRVNTAEVKSVMVNGDLRYSGTVEPLQSIPLTFQASGIVTQVNVQEGDIVRKGQVLATIDRADNESLYSSAVAQYRQAKDAYDRLKSVYDKGSLSEIKWVEMETNLKKAQSQMELTKSNLNKSWLRAPVAGIIGRRNVELGQLSTATPTPLEIVKIERILVKVSVPENEIDKIRKGMKASFSISALNDKKFEGVISNVGVVADQLSRTYEIKIEAANPNLSMKPGMVCDVNIHSNQMVKAMVVPYQAVDKNGSGDTFLYVVNTTSKRVKKTSVKVGDYEQNGIIVYAGVANQSVVVTEGKEKLSDNAKIVY